MVEFFDPITDKKISFHLTPRLQKNLDEIKEKLQKKDKDHPIIIDGYEGSGKSVFGMQISKYVDPTLCLDRICMNPQQFKDAIIKAQPHQAVIFDEAFTGLSARSSLSEINRMLVSMMMQMRQKNLFVVVILPNVFMLDKYVALSRAAGLFHIWEKKGRHYWRCFNRNKLKRLILTGSKTYTYHQVAKFVSYKGNFYGKYVIDEDAYRDKKRKALEEAEENIKEHKYIIQRNLLIYILIKELGLTQTKVAKLCKKHKIPLTQQAVSVIFQKFVENPMLLPITRHKNIL